MKKDVYFLTAPQNSIWLTEQFYQGTNINNICGSMTIFEKVDFDKFSKAINIFVENTDSFRIKLFMDNTYVKQYISDYIPFELEIINVSSDEDVKNIEKQIASIPFNLMEKLLFTFKLFKFPDGHGGFVVNAHHIISDSWTLGIVVNRIINIYSCLLNNENINNLNNFSYIDYINSEQNYLKSDKYIKDKEYWDNIYSTIPEIATIPSCNKDTSKSISIAANRELININNEQLININTFCVQNKVSIYNFFMAVFSIYLSRVSNLDDFVIGTPILNRTNFKEKNTAGMFINTIPFRISINHNETFKEFVSKIAINSMGMLRHQKYSYQYILENLRKQDSSLPNLYKVMLSYQVTKMTDNNDFIPHSSRWTFNQTTSDDLDIHLYDFNDSSSLNIAYDYNISKYSQEDIIAIHKRILHIINQIVDNNNVVLKNIEIVTPEEKHQLLVEFNNTSIDYPKDKTVVQLFEEQVEKNPDNIAVIFENQKLTYRELNEKANQLAYYLISAKIEQNNIIGIMLERSFETIICMLAVLKTNSAYMLIDPTLPDDRIIYMLNNANSPLLITSRNIRNINFKNKLFIDKENLNNYNKNNLNLKYDIDNSFCIIYTSGSTGNPKGVELKNKGIVNLVLSYKTHMNTNICNNFLSISTVAFDMFIVETFVPLLSGKTMILSNTEEQKIPTSISNLIKKHNAEFILTTPSRIELLLMNENTKSCLKYLKIIQLGGEIFTANLFNKLKKYTNANIYNGYGPSEITACCANKNISSSEITIGKPFCNTHIYILNSDLGLCPIGIEGEICISGDGLAKGYINNSSATQKAFIKNPFGDGLLYRTGDIGKYNSNGELEYIGRKDFQIKMRGLRIELSEIERQLLNIPHIKNCAIIYKEQPENNSYLAAFFTSNRTMDISYIRAELSKHLPLYMVPKYIIQLKNMPITRNGKIDLKTLKKYEISAIETENYVAPENELQKLFCDTWEKLLNTKVGINNDIFELGADSLLAIKFKVEMLSNNIDVQYADIFKYPTVKGLSEANKITIKKQIDNYDYTEINSILSKNNIRNYKNIQKSTNNNVLLLGSNGFVGMHILYNFIKNDFGNIYCIVRDKNKLSARTRFLTTLHFYFNDELDKFIDNRIIILKGDITKENFGLEKNLYNDIVNKISIVINSSANVKHYGNFKNFENINIGLTKKAIEFCEKYNKRLIQISSISVCGNVYDKNITFSENNLYIGQSLDNVYIKSKFEAERIILEHISAGLNAQILRLGNITNRYSDSKFQINPEENAFIGRLQSLIKLGVIPDYLLNTKLEFTPVDLCGYAIILTMQNYVPDFNVFHLYNNYYITMKEFITALKEYNINLNTVTQNEFNKIVKNALMDDNRKDILSGIINELNIDNKLEIEFNINIISEFSRIFLNTLDFNWLKIDNTYIKKYINYMKKIKFI